MKTTNGSVVEDGCKKGKLLAEMLGQLMKRVFDIIRRIEEGTISFNRVMTQLQAIAEDNVQIISRVIESLGTVLITAARTEKFIARDKFVINRDCNAKVNIYFLNDNFINWFLNKVEGPIGQQLLKCGKLRKPFTNISIVDDLGGEVKAETTLSELFCLMKIQGKGQEGILLTNGYANIFYIKDISGVLRTVSTCWFDGGWHLNASFFDSLNEWSEDRQVFSRNLNLVTQSFWILFH